MLRSRAVTSPPSGPAGFTLVEMVVSTTLVGVMLVAALNTVGASKLNARLIEDRRQGRLLAQALMAEILQQPYADAGQLDLLKTDILSLGGVTDVSFGPESGEGTGDRGTFDDIDDYDGWSASPPQEQDGTVMKNLTGWCREVTVQHVRAASVRDLADSEEGVRLITVRVTHDDKQVAELVALRAIGAPPTEACCLPDGTCLNLSADVCVGLGGTALGADTDCYTASCATGPEYMLKVTIVACVSATDLTRGPFAAAQVGDPVIISFSIDTREDLGSDDLHRYQISDYTITVASVSMTASTEPAFDFATLRMLHKFGVTPIGILEPGGGVTHNYSVPIFSAAGSATISPPQGSEPQDQLGEFPASLFSIVGANQVIDSDAGGSGVDQRLDIQFMLDGSITLARQ